MGNKNPPENASAHRTRRIKSTLDNRKSRAGQLFVNANSKLLKMAEQPSQEDLRTVLNRIRKGISTETVQEKQEDEQPA
jgi:hypothetical protein